MRFKFEMRTKSSSQVNKYLYLLSKYILIDQYLSASVRLSNNA